LGNGDAHILTSSQDIKAQEAQKDWKGQKAKEIQQKLDIIAHEESEIDYIECEVSEFDDIDHDELSDGERHELNVLHSKLRSARYLPFLSSCRIHINS
jgi:hypothetical protein